MVRLRMVRSLSRTSPSWLLISLCLITLASAQDQPAAAPVVQSTPSLPSQPAAATAVKGQSQSPRIEPPTVPLTDFQQLIAQSLGYPLPIYGASLFVNAPTTFAPVDRIPVTANYVIGPGDELLIRAWGQVDFDMHALVDRNGSIFIPKVGNLNVAGLKFEQLQGFLTSQISRIYRNFDLNVTRGHRH